MDLKEKLKFYESSLKPAEKQESSSGRQDLKTWIDGREIENQFGRFFLVTRSVPANFKQGEHTLSLDSDISSAAYAWVGKDAALQSFNPQKTLYLDTETTGLAGGAGTVPFMIGVGFFTNSSFVVEQYFMRDFTEEKAMLYEFLQRLSQYEALATYNGKCYDVNLLVSRLILHRIKNSIQQIPHLDLLFTARRLYKRRLSDCSLGNIENHILGFKRQDDVPGFLIPGIYFHYLRTGQGERLTAVFNHNHWDILSLATLTLHTGLVYSNPSAILKHDLDWFSLGRAYEALDLYEQAMDCYKKALEASDLSVRNEALSGLGFIHKRIEQWDQAIHCWEQMTRYRRFYLSPFEELAKYYEHHIRDYEKAMDWVMKALERLEYQIELRPDVYLENDREKLMYRFHRLKRKL